MSKKTKLYLFSLFTLFLLLSIPFTNALAVESGSIEIKNVSIDANNIMTIETNVSVSGNTEYYEAVADLCDGEYGYFMKGSGLIPNGSQSDIAINIAPEDYYGNDLSYLKTGNYYIHCYIYHYYDYGDYSVCEDKIGNDAILCKRLIYENGKITLLDYSCDEYGHIYDDYGWKKTKSATVLQEGEKVRPCMNCGEFQTKVIPKLKASISLSSTSKTIKKGNSSKITVRMKTGDAIKSITSSNTGIASAKKVSSKAINITAKKPGTSKVTITLKSGKKATCSVKVVDPMLQTVYITKSGNCYHRGSCPTLRSKISIKRGDAIAKGYRACKDCRP